MWRRCLSLFVAALCSLYASAEFEVDGIFYEHVPGTSDEVYVWGNWQTYEGTTSMSIPSIIKNGAYTYRVTQISGAFKGVTTIESVHLPNTITHITNSAFHGCTNLKSINIPESLQYIGDRAFVNCVNIHEIDLPSSLKSLGEYAFAGSGLREIVIPPSCTEIDQYVFQNCRQLERVVLPDTWTRIPYKTFEECYNLKSINLPSSLTTIGSNAFGYCHALESIEIPDGVTVINSEAFRNCIRLKSVSFPSSLTEIQGSAFYYCTALESVSIPPSVTTIEGNAFGDCPLVKEVIFEDGVSELFVSDEEWSIKDEHGSNIYTNSVFPYAETLYIGRPLQNAPFSGDEVIKKVTFGNNVTEIKEAAFRYCENLQSVTLSQSVKTIGAEAFYQCYRLNDVVIPEGSITTIGEKAFYRTLCSNITLPESLTEIGARAFYCCSFRFISLPPKVKTVEEETFAYSHLYSVDLGNVSTIGENAFKSSNLRSVELPASVKTIGAGAFADCGGLFDVKANSLTPPEIQASTFMAGLITLYVPERAFEEYSTTQYWKDFFEVKSSSEHIPVSVVFIFTGERELKCGEKYQVPYSVYPDFASDKTLVWTSSNEACVIVDENGLLTAVAPGESIISLSTADTAEGEGISLSVNIKVAPQETLPVAEGAIKPGRYYLTTTRTASGKYLGVDRAVLTRTNKPDESCCWIVEPKGGNMFHISNASTGKYLMSADCSLTSAEPVDLYLFTGQAAYGICRENDPKSRLFLNAFKDTEFVTSWSYDAGSSWAIAPDEGQVMEIDIKRPTDELRLGDVESMMAKVYPETAANPALLYISENPDVVTVDDDGMITGIAEGFADIVISAADGYGALVKYRVKVTAPTARTEIESEINAPEVWYDLQGRRVATPQTRGLFISNGHKVLRTGR